MDSLGGGRTYHFETPGSASVATAGSPATSVRAASGWRGPGGRLPFDGLGARERGMNAEVRNELVNLYVTSGLYRLAVGAEPRPEEAAGTSRALLALIQINLAEADYNLGRWAQAEQRLARLNEDAAPLAITRAGLLQQRAWIAAHTGRPDLAAELCAQVSIQWLPRAYHSEYFFTRAATWLALGRLDRAAREVQSGERAAVRVSSKRNALFLQARVAAASGALDEAERWCRRGAAHPFRSQGGDGLLLFGDVLARLERPEEAAEAWRLAIGRDPESGSARLAAARLGALEVRE